MDIASQLIVISGVLQEVVTGLGELELCQPLVHDLLYSLSVQQLSFVIVFQVVLDHLVDGYLFGLQELLNSYSVGDDVALHGLLLQPLQLLQSLQLCSSSPLLNYKLASRIDGVHEPILVQVVIRVQFKALMQ